MRIIQKTFLLSLIILSQVALAQNPILPAGYHPEASYAKDDFKNAKSPYPEYSNLFWWADTTYRRSNPMAVNQVSYSEPVTIDSMDLVTKICLHRFSNFTYDFTRDTTNRRQLYNLCQPYGQYIPFGVSFSNLTNFSRTTLDVSGGKKAFLRIVVSYSGATPINLQFGVLDINNKLINAAGISSINSMYVDQFEVRLDYLGATNYNSNTAISISPGPVGDTITIDFNQNAYNSVYSLDACSWGTPKNKDISFDYTKLYSVIITALNTPSFNGNDGYKRLPLLLKKKELVFKSFFVGDLSAKLPQTIYFPAIANRTFKINDVITLPQKSLTDLNLVYSYTSIPSGILQISGNQVTVKGAGSVTITAAQEGNGLYGAAKSVPQSFVISKSTQQIIVSAIPPKIFTDVPFNISPTSSSGLVAFTFSMQTGNIIGIEANGIATINSAGVDTVTVLQAGDNNYLPTFIKLPVYVKKAPQLISNFGTIPSKTYGDAPFGLTATANSGSAVTFLSNDLSVATISGTTVTIVGAGSATISAKQTGNANYTDATISQTLTVSKASLNLVPLDTVILVGASIPETFIYSISGYKNGDKSLTGAPVFTLPLNVSSSSYASYIITGSIGTLASSKYDFTFKTGTLYITSNRVSQNILFSALPAKTYGDGPLTLSASASSGLALTFSSSDSSVATVSGKTVTILGAGSATIIAKQAGNANYTAATFAQTLTIVKAALTVVPNDSVIFVGATLPVIFTYSIKGYKNGDNSITGVPAFSLPVNANSSSVANYSITGNIGSLISKNYFFIFDPGKLYVTANGIIQTITFNPLPKLTKAQSGYLLDATSNSPLNVSFLSSDTNKVAVHGRSLIIKKDTATVTISAFQSGDVNYAAAPSVSRKLSIIVSTIRYDTLALSTQLPSVINTIQNSTTASVQVKNTSLVKIVLFGYRPITTGIWNYDTVRSTSNTYTYTLDAQKIGEIGASCLFKIIAKNELSFSSDSSYVYTQYDQGIPYNNLSYGTSQSNYNIISIPYELTDNSVPAILSNLGSYDQKKWRLFQFNKSTQVNEEYPAFTNLKHGVGYWLIKRNPVQLNIPSGRELKVTENKPDSLSLKIGWNMIGNPYYFDLYWPDVIKANPGKTLSQFVTYQNGSYNNVGSTINKLSGAFVYASTAMSVKVPTYKKTSVQQLRIANDEVTPTNWTLPIGIQHGSAHHHISGVGMAVNASEGFDENDLPSFSSPFDLAMMSFPVQDNKVQNLSFSVVPEVQNYTWNLKCTSPGSPSVLTWDSSRAGLLTKELFLFNPLNNTALNMKQSSNYRLTENKTADLQILYGDENYISEGISANTLKISSYPNPVSETLYISILIPKTYSGSDFKIVLEDITGKKLVEKPYTFANLSEILTLSVSEYKNGMYVLFLESAETHISHKININR